MKWIFFLLILLAPVEGYPLLLRDTLKHAEPGDYIVSHQNKTYTLMRIDDATENTLIIEEITAPENHRNPNTLSWQGWLDEGAPRHTGWVMYEVQLPTGTIQEFFSFSQKGWLDLSAADNLLSTLLNLPLQRIPEEQRRRQGPPPSSDMVDRRTIWQPRLIVEGQIIRKAPFHAWQAHWPKDGGELADKKITLYLPAKKGNYPSFFPYWLEVEGTVGRAHIRLVDSGKNLSSPTPALPRCPPEFLDNGQESGEDGEGLTFRLRSRPYYEEFSLFAVNVDRNENEKAIPISLPCSAHPQNEQGIITLTTPLSDLQEKLIVGNRYHFIAIPTHFESAHSKTPEPFLWKG